MVQKPRIHLSIALVVLSAIQVLAGGYKNFKVAVYCRAYEVQAMSDLQWLESTWEELARQVHVDKIYLETHRDLLIVDDFFFTSCKCELCIDAKKDLSWTDYRLELMKNAAVELVIKPHSFRAFTLKEIPSNL